MDEEHDKVEIIKEVRKPPFHYYEQQLVRRVHHFYLSRPIGDAEEYVEMIHRIKMAGPEEMIFIHLNTPGGNLVTGVQIVNALQSSQAHIVCSVEAESHSLGTLIFLAADEFIVHDNCIMMFHNFSGGVFGKGHEQVAQLNATVDWFTDLARRLYIPFLSEEEFESIIRGEDLWMNSQEIRERLKNMVELLEKQKQDDAVPESVTLSEPEGTLEVKPEPKARSPRRKTKS